MRIAPAIRKALLALAFITVPVWAYAASILPQGETQFLDDDGNPLSSGEVYFYIPSTTTPKNTWQDSGESTLNTNPVVLDAGGRAIIYGDGSYRMIVKDSDGNTIYDAVTAAPGTDLSGIEWGGTSGGSANAQTITAAGFDGTDGSVIAFVAGLTNTGATTITTSGFGATAVRKDLPSGPVALVGGEIRAGNVVMLTYDSSAGVLHLINQPDPFGGTAPAGVAAATTTDVLGSVATVVNVTGAATITSLGTAPNRFKIVYFLGANTLTHNATSLILPGGSNITTAANDAMGVVSDASGNARVVWYQGPGVSTFDPAVDNLFTATQSITITGSGAVLNGVSTDAGAVSGPNIDLYRNSASPAASDQIGEITYSGEDSAGNQTTYAQAGAVITDPTDASEDAQFNIAVISGAASLVPFSLEGTTQTLVSTDGSASVGPQLRLYRNSASPAASDVTGRIEWLGRDSASADQVHARQTWVITDPTAGSDDGYIELDTVVAGSVASRMQVGGGVYHPSATGGDQGNNTINFGSVYQNGAPIRNAANSSFSANKNGSNQNVATTATTLVTFGTELFDQGSNFASNQWTPPAGWAVVNCHLTIINVGSGNVSIIIRRAGSAYLKNLLVQASIVVGDITAIVPVNGSQTVDCAVSSTTDNNYDISGTVGETYFQGWMVGGS